MKFMTEETIKNLSFDYILNGIRPITQYGIEEKQRVKPYFKGDEKNLKEEFNKIKTIIHLHCKHEIVNILKHIKYIAETIKKAENDHILNEVEIFEIKNFLINTEKIQELIYGNLSVYDDLKLNPMSRLLELLDPANEKMHTFYIYDEYSEKLKTIRNNKKSIEVNIKNIKKQLIETIEKEYGSKFNFKDELIIKKSEKEKIEQLLSEKNLIISFENYFNLVFKLKNNNNIDFLESELNKLITEEDYEELIIRQNISSEIKGNYNNLLKNVKVVGKLDYLIAKADYAVKTNSVEPLITDNLEIIIKGGRNLKLEDLLKKKGKEYTYIDLEISKNVVCVTGANMGGKTVSLKMLGQIAAMASYGMFVPCEYARICLFDHIYISAGDDQSIEKGLSTFGAEIVNLKEALDYSNNRCLILIDELAAGTNPKEGYAITKAVINYLKKKNCISVITTHYDNVANDDEILNLQVAGLKLPESTDNNFKLKNINEISNYMNFRLIEVKHKSKIPKDALKIAKMAGINQEIIEDAERYL